MHITPLMHLKLSHPKVPNMTNCGTSIWMKSYLHINDVFGVIKFLLIISLTIWNLAYLMMWFFSPKSIYMDANYISVPRFDPASSHGTSHWYLLCIPCCLLFCWFLHSLARTNVTRTYLYCPSPVSHLCISFSISDPCTGTRRLKHTSCIWNHTRWKILSNNMEHFFIQSPAITCHCQENRTIKVRSTVLLTHAYTHFWACGASRYCALCTAVWLVTTAP